MLPRRIARVTLGALAAALLASLPGTASAACKPARYQLFGQVLDPSGRPVADARVRLLLDELRPEALVEASERAISTRTNAAGNYLVLVDCEAAAGISDAPNPCAAKPRALTVAIDSSGFGAKWVVFRLKELAISKDAGGCFVEVTDIRLSAP